jgi:hypothetical protein
MKAFGNRVTLRARFHSDTREQHNAQPLIDSPDLGASCRFHSMHA